MNWAGMTCWDISDLAFRKGYQLPEIAGMVNHTEEACDRYIKAYKNVEKLNRTMKSKE